MSVENKFPQVSIVFDGDHETVQFSPLRPHPGKTSGGPDSAGLATKNKMEARFNSEEANRCKQALLSFLIEIPPLLLQRALAMG